ncbi:APS2 Clathrin adaptor complex small subunit [Spraguea lophii 42_110]|uniref:APS2 Clathrin adaptor complex small subunit n=1 Tax=Spraguea lophii (strain 42_110) TaxID=1358809 RepID=S7W5W6_SPRLO|nr:APS2 Clathrin adaptor complex small subunit [Spraguea lophii 42_110]
MIEHIHIYNQDHQTRLTRAYSDITHLKNIEENYNLYRDIVYTEKNILIRQRFAGISVLFVVSSDENEFYIIELIKKYILILNLYFHRVCELHLKLNVRECYLLLDHFILGGFCIETDENVVVERVKEIYNLKA